MKTITIAIGKDKTLWHIADTTAPVDYDGFGTFTVREYNGTRTVLIRDEHFAWQTMRYSSGLKTCPESVFDEGDVAEYLWQRLRGRPELK